MSRVIVGNCVPNYNDIVQRMAETSCGYDFTIVWARDPQNTPNVESN